MGSGLGTDRALALTDCMAFMIMRIASSIALMMLCANAQAWAADGPTWVSVDLSPGLSALGLPLYPIHARALVVRLPEELRGRTIYMFGAEGKAVCALTEQGIMKVGLKPLRTEIVAGTSGVMGSIWSLTTLKQSGYIFVSGRAAKAECGTFKVDLNAGTMRSILSGPLPRCGGGGGAVSPDGMRMVRYSEGNLELTELESGAVRRIGGFGGGTKWDAVRPEAMDFAEFDWMHRASWSPDGTWISVVDKRYRIVLIDAGNFDRRRVLGAAVRFSSAAWSPDSKYLVVAEDNDLLRSGSIKAVNIETGKWMKIKKNPYSAAPHRYIGVLDASIGKNASPLE